MTDRMKKKQVMCQKKKRRAMFLRSSLAGLFLTLAKKLGMNSLEMSMCVLADLFSEDWNIDGNSKEIFCWSCSQPSRGKIAKDSVPGRNLNLADRDEQLGNLLDHAPSFKIDFTCFYDSIRRPLLPRSLR